MTSPNPYAPPTATAYRGPTWSAPPLLYCEAAGDALRLHKDASLPEACAKCGADREIARRRERLSYTPPLAYLAYLAGVLPGAVVVALLTKQFIQDVPVCPTCNARWRSSVWIQRATVLSIVLVLVLAFVVANDTRPGFSAAVLGLGFLGWIVGIIVVRFAVHRPATLWLLRVDGPFLVVGGMSLQAIDTYARAAHAYARAWSQTPPGPFGG